MKNMNLMLAIIFSVLSFSSKAQMSFKSIEEIQGIAVGSKLADFTTTDQDGNNFTLSAALAEGSVVLLFYRGQWCPVCNRYLAEIQEKLAAINATGARVVAISPDQQEDLQKIQEKTKAQFTLLYDKEMTVSKAFDVAFLMRTKNNEDWEIPVPATYIINQEAEVIWRHFDTDYKNRATAEMIIEALSK